MPTRSKKPATTSMEAGAGDSWPSTAAEGGTPRHEGPGSDVSASGSDSSATSKDFAKLTALIVEKSDAHDKKLEAIWATTRAMDSKLADIANRITQVESRVDFLEEENERLRNDPPATAAELEALRQKLDDMENRERRNNLRFVGFPERCEERDARAFLCKVLPEILNLDLPIHLELDRAHRLGAPRTQADPDHPPSPRPIIARFLRFQDLERIREAARNARNVTWKNHRIMVFGDFSKIVNDKRRTFKECKDLLHEKKINFSMDYPAVLAVKLPQGTRRFDDPKKALSYIHTLR